MTANFSQLAARIFLLAVPFSLVGCKSIERVYTEMECADALPMEHIYTYTKDGKRVKAFERAIDGKWVDVSR